MPGIKGQRLPLELGGRHGCRDKIRVGPAALGCRGQRSWPAFLRCTLRERPSAELRSAGQPRRLPLHADIIFIMALSHFIQSLPKAELHLHLEGSIDPATLLELRVRHGKRSTLEEITPLYHYTDFSGFLMAFKTITEDLRTADDYEFITYRLMEKLNAENVLHAEVYVSVGVCLLRKLDFEAIHEGLERGRIRGERDFGVSLLWVYDAVRHFGVDEARRVAEIAV